VTIQPEIEALESLAVIDSELRELNEELDRERSLLQSKKQRRDELDERLAHGRESLADMERIRNDLHAEVRQMSLQIDKSREKLSRVRTEREANAVQRELEELRKLLRDRELEIEKLVGLLDSAKSDLNKTQEERDVIGQELGQSESAVTTRLGELEGQVAEKGKGRRELVTKVKPQLYSRYELVRKRRGTAIAHTVEGTCSACHIMLSPMMYQQLMRNESFGQCPSCNRILYFKAAAGESETQSSGP
jgi:predicted  nucleic acid-binding Zn-ribbon protein